MYKNYKMAPSCLYLGRYCMELLRFCRSTLSYHNGRDLAQGKRKQFHCISIGLKLIFILFNLQVISLIIYHISLMLFLWAYFQTIFTNSNRVPRKFKIPQNLMERIESATSDTEISEILDNIVRTQQLPVQTRTNINQIRFCEKCQIIKPDRSHHCSVCGSCVLKMDHHW